MTRKAEARAQLRRLVGDVPATRFSIAARRPLAAAPTMRAEHLVLLDGAVAVRALLCGPAGPWRSLPAILYIHAHGNRYDIGADELLAGRPALPCGPYAPALAEAGFMALCLDLPCFGERAGTGESAAAKRSLWLGRTLFGEMLADLEGALDLLAAMDEVDAGRIATLGISMGATLAFWLGALDARIGAVAHLCCFADLETLVRSGAHDLHGHYMTVPGLLPAFRTGEIAGLVAPRPQLVCIGADDPLTPAAAVDRGMRDLRAAYRADDAGKQLAILVEAGVGHVETKRARATVLDFLATALRRPAAGRDA